MNATNGTGTYQTSVLMLSISSSVLSILGSIAIFGSYVFISDIRNSTRKLVTCLTVADFLSALGYLTSGVAHFTGKHVEVCKPQSFITTYSSIVSFYLTVAIAIHIFATVVNKNDKTSSWKFLLCANLISWLLPGIIICIAGVNDVLGRNYTEHCNNTAAFSIDTGPWCWIKVTRENDNYTLWVFLAGKGWEFLCYLITTSLYVLLKFYMYLRHRRRTFTDMHESLREDDQNYLYVWFVLYVLRLWGSVRSMMHIAYVDTTDPGKKISNTFMYIQAVGDPGQAFCNCILFCFLDKTVRSNIFRAYCCMSNEPSAQEETESLVTDSMCFEPHDGLQDSTNKDDIKLERSMGLLGKYSSFGAVKQGNFTKTWAHNDNCPKNVSVQ